MFNYFLNSAFEYMYKIFRETQFKYADFKLNRKKKYLLDFGHLRLSNDLMKVGEGGA